MRLITTNSRNDQNLQEESSQNSVLIIGVGVRVWPGLQSQHLLTDSSAGIWGLANVGLVAIKAVSKCSAAVNPGLH